MTTRIAALLALVPSTAVAHPGHGHTDPSAIHLALFGVAIVVGGLAWHRARRRRSR